MDNRQAVDVTFKIGKFRELTASGSVTAGIPSPGSVNVFRQFGAAARGAIASALSTVSVENDGRSVPVCLRASSFVQHTTRFGILY